MGKPVSAPSYTFLHLRQPLFLNISRLYGVVSTITMASPTAERRLAVQALAVLVAIAAAASNPAALPQAQQVHLALASHTSKMVAQFASNNSVHGWVCATAH